MKKKQMKQLGLVCLALIGSLSIASCESAITTSTKTSQTKTTGVVKPSTSGASSETTKQTTTATKPQTTTATKPQTTTATKPTTTTPQSTPSGTTETEFDKKNNADFDTSTVWEVSYDGYYSSLSNATAKELKTQLNALVSKDYTRVSYSSCGAKLKTIDSYDGNYVECLYTGQRLDKNNSGSAAGQWNKEHVFAKSHGFGKEEYDAYSDLHHLRVTECSINSKRENSYFGELDETASHDEYGNSWTSTVFCPRKEVRGDIARMILYMTVRYDDQTLDLEMSNNESELNMTGESTYGTGYMGLLNLMLKWNAEDPVDDRELSRNDAIYAVQKNRNPFIDHPELAYFLYPSQSNELGISLESLKTQEVEHKNDEAISLVNAEIEKIGTVTLESKDAIEAAEAAYAKLDQISKSFVSGYATLQKARYDYNVLEDASHADPTISTKISYLGLSSKEGSVAKNGITTSYKTGNVNADKGIYAQVSTALEIKANGVHSTVTGVSVEMTVNKAASGRTAKCTISDGKTTVEGTLDMSTVEVKTLNVDTSTLDTSAEWTITITTTANSVIVKSVTFNV